MSFVTIEFFFLFAITYFLLLLCKKVRTKQYVLLGASFIFYAWWDWRVMFLLLAEILLVYYMALYIEKEKDKKRKKYVLIFSIGSCLSILGIFKYLNFFIQSFAVLFHISNPYRLNIILPIGISFYTFQSLSYVIDVYRGKVCARKNMRKVYLYICFFPQLVAGPIVRAIDFLPQLDEDKKLTKGNFSVGAQIFLFGLIKKIVIADRLAVCVDSVYSAPGAYSGSALLCAVIAYSIQIYCDFSGYSDMAIGVARIFGYELTRNFNVPYVAQNPTEFWHRWHISLSEWLRDYLYFSLGGSRGGGGKESI